jgi:DNA-binding response OmpR family regulator
MNNFVALVVDDDKEIRDGIEIYLKNEGLKVLKAQDGMEAIERLNEHEVHIIILDMMMPRMDGIATTFKIREQKNIPIIILSAKSEDADKVLGLQVGADDYVTKPFNPLELIARVKAQLQHAYGQAGRDDPSSDPRNDIFWIVHNTRSLLVH